MGPCGRFIDNQALVAGFIQDVPASTERECLDACFAQAGCEAVSFLTTPGGGCWLRRRVTGLVPDNNKASYILCENERRDFGVLPPLNKGLWSPPEELTQDPFISLLGVSFLHSSGIRCCQTTRRHGIYWSEKTFTCRA